jgi:hypothetical protein
MLQEMHFDVPVCFILLSSLGIVRHFLELTFQAKDTYAQMWGHAVAYLVEALCYKPEVRGFDSQ